MAIKKETTENVAVKPTTFIDFLSQKVETEWDDLFSGSIVGSRMRYFRPVDRAIDAPSGDIELQIEPVNLGHFLLAVGGAITSGRYIPISSASGTFVAGETITGGSSGATATVTAYSTESDYLLTGAITGSFTDGETITGGTSSATATLTRADSAAYGHLVTMPQTTIDTTYTIEFGFDNEAYRFTGVRIPKVKLHQKDNIIQATLTVSARAEYRFGRVTAVTSSGSGSKTITVDQTTGLVATDTIKLYRPGTGFLDFSASSVKTHTVGTVASETTITVTNLQTSTAVGDLVVLAPQTPSYTIAKEFIWAGGATAILSTSIDTAVASGTTDNIEDFEITVDNTVYPKHAANGANLVNRFPAKVFTGACEVTGMLSRTYTDLSYYTKMRSQTLSAFWLKIVGTAMPTATDFNYMLDIRIADLRIQKTNTDVDEDNLIMQDMPWEAFYSSSDGYAVKALLVNESASY